MARSQVASSLLLIVLTSVAAAQGPAGPAGRAYDASKETTISGTVQEVKTFPGRRGGGTHLMVQTEAGPVDVHVGPSWYLSEQQFTFSAGDAVKVTGSKTDDAVIAREITREDKTLVLRDAAGIPKWRRRGGR